MGDGCISCHRRRGYLRCIFRIDGNAFTDREYYLYLKNLIYRLFGRSISIQFRKLSNSIFLAFQYNSQVNFFVNTFGFPINKKVNLIIPQCFVKKKSFLVKVLRGIFDTDGSLYFTKNNSLLRYYPIIELSTHHISLLLQLKDILSSLGFHPRISYFNDSIKLHGKKNVEKWWGEIGTSHFYKKEMYSFWKNNGYGLTWKEMFKKIYGPGGS